METIPCSSILKKLKTIEDRQNFARELGTLFFIIFRFHIAQREGL